MRLSQRLALLVATWFGAGYVPVAPGTAGSAAALPLAWALYALGGPLALGIATAAITALGVWAASAAERHYGEHDSPRIVVDEVAGQLVALLAVPCTWPNLVLAFGLFRLADSLKPWPAGWVDRRVGGGLGVVLDDVVAGAQAAAATALLVHSGAVEVVLRWI
jgi:phosphatidylglycerophosphatase A